MLRVKVLSCLTLALAACSTHSATHGRAGTGAASGQDGSAADGGPVFRNEHPRIFLSDAVRSRLTSALSEKRRSATRFKNLVDRQLAGTDNYGFQAWYAALLYQITGDTSYGSYAVNLVDTQVKAEEALISAGNAPEVARDSYLYVGDSVGDVALVYDWCWNLLTDAQRTRWLAYGNQAVWNVWHPQEAKWGSLPREWSGWAIDNPSSNYYYSFLRATMLLGLAGRGEHPDAAGWVTMFRDTKIADEVVPTFERDLIGGGSREGTGYGGSQRILFELYDWWEQSTGERIHDLTGHTRASLANFLHLTLPTLDRIAPVGDHSRDSTAMLFDYHRAYVEVLTYLYRNDPLAPHGKWFLNHCSVPEMGDSFMYVYDFLYDEPGVIEAPPNGLHPAYYAAGIGHVYTRSSWDAAATWLDLIAGPYTESHAHADQGSLLLYSHEWLADDQNLRSYSGIRQAEEMHNLVRFEQAGTTINMAVGEASTLVALTDQPAYTYVAADVGPMYTGNAAVRRVQRELVFLRPGTVVVFDRVDGAADTTRVWQLNAAVAPTVNGSSATFAGTASTLTVRRLLPATATTSVFDWSADSDMVGGGVRLDSVDAGSSGTSRFLHVLSVGDTVASGVSDDSGTRRGVTLEFADAGSATVRFETDTWGGDLEIRDANGVTQAAAELVPGVSQLPLFD